MVMAGYSLLDTLVEDACLRFYAKGADFPSGALARICGEVALLDAQCRRAAGGRLWVTCWCGMVVVLRRFGRRADISGGWCCPSWQGGGACRAASRVMLALEDEKGELVV